MGRFIKNIENIEIDLTYDPDTQLLSIYPKGHIPYYKDTSLAIFIAMYSQTRS